MHRGQQTIPSDWGSCKKVEYKEAADFFASQANSACYPGGIHISGFVLRCKPASSLGAARWLCRRSEPVTQMADLRSS